MKLKHYVCIAMVLTLLLAAFAAQSRSGQISAAETPPADGIPSVPTGLSVAVVSTTQINLSWNPSVDDSAIQGYWVYGGKSSTPRFAFGTSYSDTNLQPNTLYCYSVSALDNLSNESDQCPAVCATTDSNPGPLWETMEKGTDMDLTALATNGSRIVVVGDDSQVLTSEDGSDWLFREPALISPQGMRDVVWNGSKFVGVKNWTYTSVDGIGWNVNPTTTDELVAVAYSDTLNLHIAVGEEGLIMSSPDGVTWQVEEALVQFAPWLSDVVWGNGRFIAVRADGVILSSTNGSDWGTVHPGTNSNGLNGVTWSGTEFVAVGNSEVLKSDDGTTWTPATPPALTSLESVAWSNTLGMYAAVGLNGNIFTSATGSDWTDRSPIEHGPSYEEVIWDGPQFIAVGELGEIITSSDGVTWTTQTSGSNLQAVIWDGKRFVAVGYEGKVLTSSNGETWTYDSSGDGSDFLLDIAWSGSKYAVGAQTAIYMVDQSGWSDGQWLGATSGCDGMMWSGVQYVGVGSGAGGATILTSPDGDTFSYQDSGLGQQSALEDVTWNGVDQYIAVGYYGHIISSPDGAIWSQETSNTSNNLYGMTYGGGQYVAVGAAGTIVTSPNGSDWSVRDSTLTTNDYLFDVVFTGTDYVAVGRSGRIVTSEDGVVWSADQYKYTTYRGVAWNGRTLVAVGDDGTVVRLRRTSFSPSTVLLFLLFP